MPIPDFDAGGILPTGIYDCDLPEIEATFVYNETRETIWNGYTSYLEQVKAIPEVKVIYVDGGFVTNKELPKDIDIIFEFPSYADLVNVTSRLPVLFDRDGVKATYKVDILYTLEPIPPGVPDLREYFQYLRPEEAIDRGVPAGTKKGILKIAVK